MEHELSGTPQFLCTVAVSALCVWMGPCWYLQPYIEPKRRVVSIDSQFADSYAPRTQFERHIRACYIDIQSTHTSSLHLVTVVNLAMELSKLLPSCATTPNQSSYPSHVDYLRMFKQELDDCFQTESKVDTALKEFGLIGSAYIPASVDIQTPRKPNAGSVLSYSPISSVSSPSSVSPSASVWNSPRTPQTQYRTKDQADRSDYTPFIPATCLESVTGSDSSPHKEIHRPSCPNSGECGTSKVRNLQNLLASSK